jgi:hypothetical protein
MGLDSFKTEGPRSQSRRSSDKKTDRHAIHVAHSVDTEEINIPGTIRRHDVEYLEIVEAGENSEGNVICTCMECTLVATSYEAMVKVDHLKFRDSDWYSEFKQLAIANAPDKPSSLDGSDLDGIPDTNKEEDSDSGLMSFKS